MTTRRHAVRLPGVDGLHGQTAARGHRKALKLQDRPSMLINQNPILKAD